MYILFKILLILMYIIISLSHKKRDSLQPWLIYGVSESITDLLVLRTFSAKVKLNIGWLYSIINCQHLYNI